MIDFALPGVSTPRRMSKTLAPTFRGGASNKAHARLIDAVKAACGRLAGGGWAELFALHGLDIVASDLGAELSRDLPDIDRSQPGFGDFALEGMRGIEPGQPALSFLYHALASPEVVSYRAARGVVTLTVFPTAAEIEAVENYLFGRLLPSIEDLRARAQDAPLAIVVFSAEYRPGSDTVHRKHADLCFSRTGVARIGTMPHAYRPAARGYLPTVEGDGKAVAALPCRYSAYVAALVPGLKGRHGPMHFFEPRPKPTAGAPRQGKDAGLVDPPPALRADGVGDGDRKFWLPLHKLFDGPECLRGYDLRVRLAAQHINEKIRRAHLFFGAYGHDSGWQEPDISDPPFVLRDGIAAFSSDANDGSWLLAPTPRAKLVEPATYKGQPLTYKVPRSIDNLTNWRNYQSSLRLNPRPSGARAGPEYLHARHVVTDASEENLNQAPCVVERVREGGYRARHYVDYTGDGWIAVECSALALEIPRRLSAYSIVATPDYFPVVRQGDLVRWTDQSAPPALLSTIWPINPGRPEPLSAQRYAANLELPGAGFDKGDDTMTAIVASFGSGGGAQTRLEAPKGVRCSTLPDGASGVFAPGWDVSYDRSFEESVEEGVEPGVTFLTNYGLGSPFAEDAMLCAALSSYWPAVAPDITRTFAPGPRYATSTPLTDEVIGLGGTEPWDGIRGPIDNPATKTVEYRALAYGDYVEAALDDKFDLSIIGTTTVEDYIARTLTMAMVYEALGASEHADKVRWAVLSFRPADPHDPDLAAACAASGRRLDARFIYRYEMIHHDGLQAGHQDPAKFDRVVVTYSERVLLFADPTIVLRQVSDGSWAGPYERTR